MYVRLKRIVLLLGCEDLQVHIILSRNWQSLVTKADWGAVLWGGFEKNTKNCQARCYMDVVVLLDCWTRIHLRQRTCSPSESLLQCIFQCLAVWTSLLVAYPKFLFATTIEIWLRHRPLHLSLVRSGGVEWNWTILCYVTSRIFWVQLLKVFLRPSNLMIQRTWRRAKAAARLALWEIAPWENCLLRTEIHYETIWNYCDNYELTRISNATLVWFINIPPFAGADSICPRRPNWGASAAWFISIIWMKSFLQPNPHSHMHWLQLQFQSILTCFYYISCIAIYRYVYL